MFKAHQTMISPTCQDDAHLQLICQWNIQKLRSYLFLNQPSYNNYTVCFYYIKMACVSTIQYKLELYLCAEEKVNDIVEVQI